MFDNYLFGNSWHTVYLFYIKQSILFEGKTFKFLLIKAIVLPKTMFAYIQ